MLFVIHVWFRKGSASVLTWHRGQLCGHVTLGADLLPRGCGEMKAPKLPKKRVVFILWAACLLKVWVVASEHVEVGAVCNTAMSAPGRGYAVSCGTFITHRITESLSDVNGDDVTRTSLCRNISSPVTRIKCWHCTFLQTVDMLNLYISYVYHISVYTTGIKVMQFRSSVRQWITIWHTRKWKVKFQHIRGLQKNVECQHVFWQLGWY